MEESSPEWSDTALPGGARKKSQARDAPVPVGIFEASGELNHDWDLSFEVL